MVNTNIVFATTIQNNNQQSKEELYSSLEEYMANAFMLSDSVTTLESDYNVSFDYKPADFTKENFNINSEWLESAKLFVNDYVSTYSNPNTRSVSQPNEKQIAKSKAIMYAIDKAVINVERDPSLDLNKESQYMFLSHYVDRYDYYWATEDERLLLDGATMSGSSGYLADLITPTDRQAYETYMGFTNIGESLNKIGNIAVAIKVIPDTAHAITDSIKDLKKADFILSLAQGIVIQDGIETSENLFIDNVIPLVQLTTSYIKNDPTLTLDFMYDRFMEDEGLMSIYSLPDKGTIVKTALSIVASFVLGGPIGAISTAFSIVVGEALSFTINTYTNFFNYVAWLALRRGFSARYADRVWYYFQGQY